MSRRRVPRQGRLPLYYRMALRHAEKEADSIIAAHTLHWRTRRTLPFFILAEALDMRTSELRRVIGKRRQAGYVLRRRWAERCDDNPDLERAIYDAAEAVREAVGS